MTNDNYKLVAIALDKQHPDYQKLYMEIKKLVPYTKQKIMTAEKPYTVFIWKEPQNWDERKEKLYEKLDFVRHCIVEIQKDGLNWKNVETEDQYGSDDMFNDLLGWEASIVLYNGLKVSC